MFDYVSHDELRDCMSEIVREELEHFALVRGLEPHRTVDRLMIAALIEAGSCLRLLMS